MARVGLEPPLSFDDLICLQMKINSSAPYTYPYVYPIPIIISRSHLDVISSMPGFEWGDQRDELNPKPTKRHRTGAAPAPPLKGRHKWP